MLNRLFLLALVAATCAASLARAEALADVTGQWRTVRHGALVDIGDCGDGTPCGRLAWVSDTISDGNTADIRNRDPALRGRPLIGVPVLYGFTRSETGWRDGLLYNPDDGKTFAARLEPLSRDRLRVTGCLGALCRSQIWTRVQP